MLKTTVAFICCFFSLSGPLRAETVEEIKAAMRSGCNFALQEKAECEINKECHSLEGEFLKWQSCEEDCQRRAKAASEYNEFVRECRRQLEKNEQKANQQPNKGKPSSGASSTIDWSKLKKAAEKKGENADAKNEANIIR
jgi:hypothetical protein